jgi:hypothetical protein
MCRNFAVARGRRTGFESKPHSASAARLLGVQLMAARTVGYDAVRTSAGRRFQIKITFCCDPLKRDEATAIDLLALQIV